MPVPYIDPCLAPENQVPVNWSQAAYQIARWRWQNGCDVAKPDPAQGWGNTGPTGFPPVSYTFPGNPDDRQPGQG